MKNYIMELTLNNKTYIKDLIQSFSNAYPYLRIEIFKYPYKNRNSGTAQKLDPNKSLGRLLKPNQDGKIDISSGRTVAQLERDFRDKVDLLIQVFRKSGKLWIETTLTEDWTLDRQNKEGEIFSTPVPKKSLEDRLEEARFDMD